MTEAVKKAQRIYRKQMLREVTGYAPEYIDQLVREGKFPAPDFELSRKVKAWSESAIAEWQRSRLVGEAA